MEKKEVRLNVRRLGIGDKVRILVDNPGMGLKAGDLLTVKTVGFSKWDGMYYADVVTDNGWQIEIMKNAHEFELT